ncbi:4'-phosphopantetheinyl transferase family protein [Arthrobacter sp. LjRoot14]|uniref:4'-phosphopantetheinyl transferase family protein n=1 Tax=Arthrobacter sp. LjRoot14 TaxID=3342265 RepID=UPI003ECDD7DE
MTDQDTVNAHDGGTADSVAFLAVASAEAASACGPFGGLQAFLSPGEIAASQRFRRTEDQTDYQASHALFRLLAAWSLGLSPREAAALPIARRCGGCGGTEHGKPSVPGVCLSLSRSHGAVMVAAGPEGSILGADIERLPEQVFDGFDDFTAAPSERALLRSASVTDRMLLWVAKEAVLKAAGVGLAVEPSSVALTFNGGTHGSRRTGLRTAVCPGQPEIHGLEVRPVTTPPGYVAAVSSGARLPAHRLSLPEMFATSLQTSNV